MALTNYTDLIAGLNGSGGWLHRTDLGAILPDWVTLAETTMNYGDLAGIGVDGLRTASMEVTTTLTATQGVQTVTLPTDFLSVRKMYLTFGSAKYEMRELPTTPMSSDERWSGQGMPLRYIIVGNTLQLFPLPNGTYTITLLYYQQIGPLRTQGTNWLMTAAPMVYLSGTVVHGIPWLGPKFDGSRWVSMFKSGMAQVRRNDTKKRFGNVTLQSEAAAMVRASSSNIVAGT